MKFQIKSRFDASVIFECELDASFETKHSSIQLGAAVKIAYAEKKNLRGAYLQAAYLQAAYLQGADLQAADLRGADLQGADLRGAYLRGADLQSADLQAADLRGADGKKIKLIGGQPIISIGTLGSRQDYLLAYETEKGIYIKTGCFFDTIKAFKKSVKEKHSSNVHGKEYAAAIKMIESVFKARATK
jgi:hypothetical protein